MHATVTQSTGNPPNPDITLFPLCSNRGTFSHFRGWRPIGDPGWPKRERNGANWRPKYRISDLLMPVTGIGPRIWSNTPNMRYLGVQIGVPEWGPSRPLRIHPMGAHKGCRIRGSPDGVQIQTPNWSRLLNCTKYDPKWVISGVRYEVTEWMKYECT